VAARARDLVLGRGSYKHEMSVAESRLQVTFRLYIRMGMVVGTGPGTQVAVAVPVGFNISMTCSGWIMLAEFSSRCSGQNQVRRREKLLGTDSSAFMQSPGGRLAQAQQTAGGKRRAFW
jgi:hypothetical protein